jgi:hypothetical protein
MRRLVARLDTLRDSAIATARKGDDERGVALMTAILFMILVAGLSVVLLSVILSQATPVFVAQKTTRTIYAAQAGLQASLGVVRSLGGVPDATGKVSGVRSKLPCSVAGKVDANDPASTYSVSLKYFTLDPTGKDSNTAWITANSLPCNAGTNLFTGSVQPLYVLALADGLGAAVPGRADATYGNRSIAAIYKFKVTTVNIAGGRIWDYNNGYCLEASSAAVNSTVVFKSAATCTSAKDATQLWVYDDDYEIKLASTMVPLATPLCITSPTSSATSAAAGNATLQVCQSDATRWTQLWSWFGSNTWQGQKADNTDYSNYCLNPGTPALDSLLKVTNGCGGGFTPSTAVGAGAASYNTNQIVNYKEFGRCADVTDQQIAKSFMISYPCKQDPTGTGTKLNWNHKWFYTEVPALVSAVGLGNQQIVVKENNDDAKKNCLTSPALGGKYVTFALCNNTNTTTQRWTRFFDTGTYSTSYLFTDYLGRCLAVDATDTYTSGQWSKMIVTACNGGLEQKWNAPATYTGSDVSGYKEYSK